MGILRSLLVFLWMAVTVIPFAMAIILMARVCRARRPMVVSGPALAEWGGRGGPVGGRYPVLGRGRARAPHGGG